MLVRRADGTATALTKCGMPIGIMASQIYDEGTIDLQPGDALVLYSDGLVDMWPQPGHHGSILADMLAGTHSAQQMADRLVAVPALLGLLDDDLTVVVLYCRAEIALGMHSLFGETGGHVGRVAHKILAQS